MYFWWEMNTSHCSCVMCSLSNPTLKNKCWKQSCSPKQARISLTYPRLRNGPKFTSWPRVLEHPACDGVYLHNPKPTLKTSYPSKSDSRQQTSDHTEDPMSCARSQKIISDKSLVLLQMERVRAKCQVPRVQSFGLKCVRWKCAAAGLLRYHSRNTHMDQVGPSHSFRRTLQHQRLGPAE